MATGGFKPNATTDFLEEWKAKREKMRAKMLGDIAAATGAPLNPNSRSTPPGTAASAAPPPPPPATELSNNGNPERSASAGNCVLPGSYSVARSSSAASLQKEEVQHPVPVPTCAPVAAATPVCGLKKDRAVSPCEPSSPVACNDSDKDSPSPGKGKEKKSSSGPSARKGKGQIEKRKLREKRRSTGVVSMPSNESLDELDDDEPGGKDRKEEEELVQANTFQNEAMIADPVTGHFMETPRCTSSSSRHKSSAEEEVCGNSRQRQNRHGRDIGAAVQGSLEKRMEELEKELARERQENARLMKAHQDKDDLIGKLKEEIDLLNRLTMTVRPAVMSGLQRAALSHQ
uniref:PRKC, apoptosis, WT1, regulator n=1 Tax=Cynoglossus semilaevis TaxID=244447 RepID=A0A3P8UXB9_CYNSE